MSKAGYKTTSLAPLFAAVLMAMAAPSRAVEFGIFSDVRFSSSTDDAVADGFALGQFDIFASHQIGERTRAFVEYVFESEDGGFVVDLERLSIQYAFNEHFNLAAGRFHTPLGYWNNVYHHGALLQDTVTRPSFIDFEDGNDAILPMHTVGLFADGGFDVERGRVGYELLVGNGASIDSASTEPKLETNDAGDPNDGKAIVLRLSFTPEDQNWGVGVFAMRNAIPDSAPGAGYAKTLVDQTITGFDVRFERDRLDGMAEYYRIKNRNKTGFAETHEATAWFVQFGVRLDARFKAVVRYESVESDERDDYFILLDRHDHDHSVIGLRYDIDDSSAIKVEADRAMPEGGGEETTYIVQWSFLIP